MKKTLLLLLILLSCRLVAQNHTDTAGQYTPIVKFTAEITGHVDNPGMFSYIGVFSMGIMNFGQQNQNTDKIDQEREAKIEELKKSGYKLYWVGVGKDDFVYQGVIKLRSTLDKHNFKYTYRESTGGHTWANWRIYLSEFAPQLFR